VRFGVVTSRVLGVVGRVQMVRVRHMRVVGGLLVIPGLVRSGSLSVVVGGLRVMMRRLMMMVDSLL
jgi:hypothetical protein